jgi:hypothetical protein
MDLPTAVTGVLAVVPIFTVKNRSKRWALGVLLWWSAVAIFAMLSAGTAHSVTDTPGMIMDLYGELADVGFGVLACAIGGLGLLAQLIPKRARAPSELPTATARATSAERARR